MTTDTLTKPASAPRSTGFPARVEPPPVRIESPPSLPQYDTGYLPQPIEYPDSDGQPMAESDFQFEPLAYAAEALKVRFRDRSDVYVAGNIFFYYEEGKPSEVVSPDILVVIGAEKRKRMSYKLWEEPKAPDFVLEITSKSTRGKDQGSKKGTYQYLGVSEYFCFDPTGDYLDPPLKGYRLENGQYVEIPAKLLSSTTTVVPSAGLGLDLYVENHEFRFVDPVTGERLLNLEESERQRLDERQQRLDERRQRIEAERLASDEKRLRMEAESEARELRKKLAALERAE